MAVVDPTSSEFDAPKGLPDGTYLVFISDIETEVSENTGTESVVFEFECHDPESEHNEVVSKFNRFYITKKSTWRFVNVCRAARPEGCPPVDTSDAADIKRELLDRCLNITLASKPDTYQGQTRMRQEVTGVAPIDAKQKAKLKKAYGDKLVPAMAEEGATESKQSDGFSDDEIPY